jgi:hypothetical protein
LVPGELAINYTDGNLFYKNASNVVTVIASNKFSSVTGNVTGGNILTVGLVSATGNVTGGNITTDGLISVAGNVTANNGSFTNRVLVGAGNVSKPSFAFSDDGQTDTGFYWISDGVFGIATNGAARGNFNASGLNIAGIVSASGNVIGSNQTTAGQVSAGGNVTGANLLTGGLISAAGNVTANNGMFTTIVNVASHTGAVVSVTGNVTGGNILTGGLISATANITANYFIGNGSQLTGISAGNYSNANVAAYLPTYTGNLISLLGPVTTTANVTANYFVGNGSQLTGITNTGVANVTVDNFTGNGVQTVYTLSVTPPDINATTVNYNGAILQKSSYTLSVANVTFVAPPASNSKIEITTISNLANAASYATTGKAIAMAIVFGF